MTTRNAIQNGQLPGAGLSILRGAPVATIWTAIVSAETEPSLRRMWTWLPPGSTKLWPAV